MLYAAGCRQQGSLLAVATRMAVVAMGGQIEWIAMSHSYSPDGDSRRVIQVSKPFDIGYTFI